LGTGPEEEPEDLNNAPFPGMVSIEPGLHWSLEWFPVGCNNSDGIVNAGISSIT